MSFLVVFLVNNSLSGCCFFLVLRLTVVSIDTISCELNKRDGYEVNLVLMVVIR